ncbi:MAG: YceI family protein [Bacteroidia bacterium]
MKKLILLLFLAPFYVFAQPIFTAVSSEIHFFSAAPLENIEATNKDAKSLLNTESKEVAVIIGIRQFKFEKPLMEEHFNENYMESDKYKTADFKGKINEQIDFLKDGEHDVTVTGKLTIHGVTQDRTIAGKIIISGNSIKVNSKFPVALKDHNIKIPKAVIKNIAESVDVTVNIAYEPKSSK